MCYSILLFSSLLSIEIWFFLRNQIRAHRWESERDGKLQVRKWIRHIYHIWYKMTINKCQHITIKFPCHRYDEWVRVPCRWFPQLGENAVIICMWVCVCVCRCVTSFMWKMKSPFSAYTHNQQKKEMTRVITNRKSFRQQNGLFHLDNGCVL